MLKFHVYANGQMAKSWPLRNAYLLGSDGSAIRSEISVEDGAIVCRKRENGPAALALQYPVGECGELTVQTCLLPEREEPYLMSLELARHRLMVLYHKLEDWGLLDISEEHPATKRVELAKRLFIEALCYSESDPPRANKLATDCLAMAIDGSEELALAHAEVLLNKRKKEGALPKYPIGAGVSLDQAKDRIRASLANNFDFLYLPTPWRDLAVSEEQYRWEQMDSWVDWAAKHRLPVVAGPVVSFEPSQLPDWIYIWEHDFETVRDVLYEHTESVVTRYRNAVVAWNVVSGLHVNSHFTFSFDQLLDLTRMSTMLVKKIQPQSRTLVEIRQPFGEYYSANQRSIPPVMYADLLIQGGIQFDGFAIKLLMGQAVSGQYTRDLMQLSDLLDQFSGWGKMVHVTIAAPSEVVNEMMIASSDPNESADTNCGFWRKPWSPLTQSRWLSAVYHIAMSKPYVDSVAWDVMVDHPRVELPLSGLITEDLQPKQAFRRLVSFRRSLGGAEPIVISKEGKDGANGSEKRGPGPSGDAAA